MAKIKKIFIELLKLFTEEEYEVLINKSNISFYHSKNDAINFQIEYYEKPSIKELTKFYFFKDKNVSFEIKLLYLYNSLNLYELIIEFLKETKKIDENNFLDFESENLEFQFPEVIFIIKNSDLIEFWSPLLKEINLFLNFVFENTNIKLKILKNSKTTQLPVVSSKFIKTDKYLIFEIRETIFYGKNIKRLSIGITDFVNYYSLSLGDNLKTNKTTEQIKQELIENEWYEITYRLCNNDENQKTKSYDGWIDSYKKIDTPKEYLKNDLSHKKINCLSVRTKYSSFDGLFNFENFAQQAKKFGHNALAITDFCNVHAFPQVEAISKKLDLKPLYGCDFEIIPDNVKIVENLSNYVKTEEAITFCIFDIETTGLYPLFDELIEIAIIKYKNGIEVENYHSYVKCEKKLKKEIIDLTNITEEKLEKFGKNIKIVLQEIKEFIKNSVLIAHNGIEFDLPFLNAQFIKNDLEIINNPLLDTLYLSKAIYHKEKYKSHALAAVAKRCSIQFDETNAHTAIYDTKILSQIWKIFESELNNLDFDFFNSFDKINDFFPPQTLKKNYFGENVLIFAKNQKGIEALYKLVTFAHIEHFFDKPTINKKIISEYRENLIVVSSPINSGLFSEVLKNNQTKFNEKIDFFDYLIIPPPNHFLHDINRNFFSEEDIKQALNIYLRWAKLKNKKVILNYYAKFFDYQCIEQYKVIVHAKNIGGKRHYLHSYKSSNEILPDYSFRTSEELLQQFKFLNLNADELYEIAFENQEQLIKQIDCGIKIIHTKLNIPEIENIEEKINFKIYEKLHSKYGKKPNEYLINIINKELNGIIGNGYGVVYWISHLLVQKSMKDGYLVGSRGSVGSSFVAHLLEISEVNPLPAHYFCCDCSYLQVEEKFIDSGFDLPSKTCPKCQQELNKDGQNIPFETFLGLESNKVPDIDLNFSGEYQMQIHNYLRELFGKEHTFRLGTINTVAKKTADTLATNYLQDNNFKYTTGKINWLSNQVMDMKRTTGQHPGGILIVPKTKSIYEFTPLNCPANDLTSEWLTTHFESEYLHDALFKFDILGHDDPTFLAMLQKLTGINPKQIKYDDKKILNLFHDIGILNISDDVMGETVGTIGLPEFGTLITRKILRACKSNIKTFADLIRISGISHGTNVWKNNIDQLIKVKKLSLNQTITCRDDIMIYLNSCGIDINLSFKITESIRKGKGIPVENLEILKKHNVPEWYIESANKISYIFPKAHASAYVLMSWKIAFFKIYYPLEFYATYFSINNDHFDLELLIKNDVALIKEKYVRLKEELKTPERKFENNNKSKYLLTIYEVAIEMLIRKIKFINIDINTSDANIFIPIKDQNSILIPFMSIDGLGMVKANLMLKSRNEQGPYLTREDIEKRMKLNTTLLKNMEKWNIIPNKSESQSAGCQITINDLN